METAHATTPQRDIVSTGIEGLDEVLRGGLPRDRFYLVDGDPGTGKTTLALQFLLAGRDRGETCLYLTLSETEDELSATAVSHGFSLEGIHVRELISGEAALATDQQYSVFDPSEVELGDSLRDILAAVEELHPKLVVIDSLSEIRLLAHNPLRYRRQVYALKQFLSGRHCTVLMLDDRTADGAGDHHLQSIAQGVIRLEQLPADFGGDRRRLRVIKLRSIEFVAGYHDMLIQRGGLVVFARLVSAAMERPAFIDERLPSGNDGLDALLSGGLHRGVSALIMGPVGTGKSSISALYAYAAARRGEKAALFLFDESRETVLHRSAQLGSSLREMEEARLVEIRQVDPAQLSPGEFTGLVRAAAEDGAKLVVIDSLNGYFYAMPGERQLILQLHELLSFLTARGITTILTEGQHGIMGSSAHASIDASYLADTILMIRYFEAAGAICKAISVVKNRTSAHEATIRELRIDGTGIQVGEPLRDFHGILTGVPTFKGKEATLFGNIVVKD